MAESFAKCPHVGSQGWHVIQLWCFNHLSSSHLGEIRHSSLTHEELRPRGRDWPVSQLTKLCRSWYFVWNFYLSHLSVTVCGSGGTPQTRTSALNYTEPCRSVTGPHCLNQFLLMINHREESGRLCLRKWCGCSQMHWRESGNCHTPPRELSPHHTELGQRCWAPSSGTGLLKVRSTTTCS